MSDKIAEKFLLMGLQSWGQSDVDRAAASDDYLRAAGFNLKDDTKEAGKWLNDVLNKMSWGKMEREVAYLQEALNKRNVK